MRLAQSLIILAFALSSISCSPKQQDDPDTASPNPPSSNTTNKETSADKEADQVTSEKNETSKFSIDSVPLIPRKKFFGNPEKARARLSPDGSKLALLAPVDNVLNIWVGTTKELAKDAKPITKETVRGIRSFFWAYTNNHVLYTQDNDGDEDFHLYCVDLASGEITDLTPIKGIRAQIDSVSEKFPNEILVGINDRNPQLHDIYKINIETGEKELVQENPGFAGFVTDDDYQVRFAVTFTPDAGQLYLQPQAEEGQPEWKDFLKVGPLDAMTTGLSGFDKTGKIAYLFDSRDRNTAALKSLDLETGKETLIAENEKADISGAIVHPTEKTIQAVAFTYGRREWLVLDPAIQADLDYLKTVEDGEVQLTSRTLDDSIWTVAYTRDDGPVDFYVYYRGEEKKTEYLFSSQPELEELPLVKMHDIVIKSRDELNLVSYLTLPKGSNPEGDIKTVEPLPLVLDVHGGPWARDTWGYNPIHQLLANRGYAVLSVNYRGSTGFGKDFINAANKEWAGKMHDDLIDAVDWAIDKKIADPDKIAIMGGSYGGYATLVGLTFTPDKFTCGIDIVGPSSLVTLLNNPPPYWMPFMPVMKFRVGDHTSEEGVEFLESRSPLNMVEKINKPLLIGQGANDPRVKQAEADQIVAAMNAKNIPVTYMLFPDEGHGFARPENRFAFNAVSEAFLAKYLGGRFEPIGEAFQGANFEIPSGQKLLPGLEEALQE